MKKLFVLALATFAIISLVFACKNNFGKEKIPNDGTQIPDEIKKMLEKPSVAVPSKKDELSSENQTILTKILEALKENEIYTNIPDNERPALDNVNLYRSEYVFKEIVASDPNSETTPAEVDTNHFLLVLQNKTTTDKHVAFFVEKTNDIYTFAKDELFDSDFFSKGTLYYGIHSDSSYVMKTIIQNFEPPFIQLKGEANYYIKFNNENFYMVLVNNKIYNIHFFKRNNARFVIVEKNGFFEKPYVKDVNIDSKDKIIASNSDGTSSIFQKINSNTWQMLNTPVEIIVIEGDFYELIKRYLEVNK